MALAQTELVTAQNDAERASARAKLATAQQQARATQTQISSVRGGSKAAGSANKAACKCEPGDPLCACF